VKRESESEREGRRELGMILWKLSPFSKKERKFFFVYEEKVIIEKTK
jgi:hypothetical protein